MAINIALTLKGLKPEVDVPKISYKGDWRTVKVYFYKGFSLIEGICAFEVRQIGWNNDKWTLDKKVYNEVLGLAQVDAYLTHFSDIKMQGIKEDECPNMEDLDPIIEELTK